MVKSTLTLLKAQLDLIIELIAFACAIIGIAQISYIAALIIGGITVIAAVEIRPSSSDKK